MNVRFGIKISTQNKDLIPEIYKNNEIFKYIEIILNPNFDLKDIELIQNLKLPYAIHLPNSNNGIDFGDINLNNNNIALIKKIEKFRMNLIKLKPICYIIHPESGNIDLSISNINKLKIAPIAIENMPKKGIHGRDLLGYNPNSLKKYFDKIDNLEFCFDINHGIKAAISMKIDYITFIKEFLKFKKPILFHISGGNLIIEIDEHLSFDRSQYNLSEIRKILLNYEDVVNLTLETPRNYKKKIVDDLKNIKIFLKDIKK